MREVLKLGIKGIRLESTPDRLKHESMVRHTILVQDVLDSFIPI